MEDMGWIVDRDHECDSLLSAIDDGYRIMVINGAPESGFSCFCKKAAFLLATQPDAVRRFDVLLLELESEPTDFAEALVNAVIISNDNLDRRLAKGMANLHRGVKPGTADIVGAAMQAVVSAGTSALCSALNVDALSLTAFATAGSATCYSGLFSRVFSACTSNAYAGEMNPDRAFAREFLKGVGRQTVILIDGAQKLSDRSLDDLIDVVASNNNIVLALGLTAENNGKAVSRALVKAGDRCAEALYAEPISFGFPNLELLRLLNETVEPSKTDEELAVMLAEHQDSIWDLIRALRTPSDGNLVLRGEPRAILEACEAFGEPIAHGALEALLSSKMNPAELAGWIQWLEALGFLRASAPDLVLATEIGEKALGSSDADLLFRRNEILSFFESYVGPIDYLSLRTLMHLAHDVYPTSLQPVRSLVKRYVAEQLSRGLPVNPPSLLDVAFPSTTITAQGKSNIKDLIIKLASLFVLQDFLSVVSTVEMAGEEALAYEEVRVYYAIALNRIRDHKRADEHLRKLFYEGGTHDVKAVTACYYIVNLLYLNQPSIAKEAYKHVESLSRSVFYPYVLRNCASLMSGPNLVKHLKNVLDMENVDQFCRATVHNNLGRAYIATGQLEEAENELTLAKSEVASFHYRNEAIIANNMAILKCKQGRLEEALAFAKQAKMMAIGEMPANRMQQLFIDITLSALMFKSKDPQYESFVDELERNVLAHDVRHTQEVYYANRALFEVLSDSPKASEYVQKLAGYRNVLRPGRTDEIVKIMAAQIKDKALDSEMLWDRCFDPPYLVFWYVNPNLISEHVIADYLEFALQGSH